MHTLLDNMSGCTVGGLWHKCSQAAAIHYDLAAGSLGQRARSCGLQKPIVPGDDFTTPTKTDNGSCRNARDELLSAFENRAMARLACAAARVGGADQAVLDAKCIELRSRLSSYHAPFRSVAKHCQIDYERTYAMTTTPGASWSESGDNNTITTAEPAAKQTSTTAPRSAGSAESVSKPAATLAGWTITSTPVRAVSGSPSDSDSSNWTETTVPASIAQSSVASRGNASTSNWTETRIP